MHTKCSGDVKGKIVWTSYSPKYKVTLLSNIIWYVEPMLGVFVDSHSFHGIFTVLGPIKRVAFYIEYYKWPLYRRNDWINNGPLS